MSLGVVVISRNDGYGGDQPDKVLYSLASYLHAADEVIYVDWASPNDQSLLPVIEDRLPSTGKLRGIQITNAMARELTNNNPNVQLCVEVLARNIGLRRLHTDYMISTNGDVMCLDRTSIDRGIRGPGIFHCIARRETHFPTVRAWGEPGTVKLVRALYNGMSQFQQHQSGSPLPGDPWSLITAPGDFQLAHRDVWYGIRGYEESLVMRGYSDSNVQKKASIYGFGLELIRDIPAFHFGHYPDTGASGGTTNTGWNDMNTSLMNFTATSNPESWGFAGMTFPEINL